MTKEVKWTPEQTKAFCKTVQNIGKEKLKQSDEMGKLINEL